VPDRIGLMGQCVVEDPSTPRDLEKRSITL
jgi:hypothetical protein